MPRRRRSSVNQNDITALEEGKIVDTILRSKFGCPISEIHRFMKFNVFTFAYYVLLITYMLSTGKYVHFGSIVCVFLSVAHVAIEITKYSIHEYYCTKNIKYSNNWMDSISMFLAMFISTLLFFHIICVLYGAEVFTGIIETFVCSTILAALVQFPQYLHTKSHFISYIFGVTSIPNHLVFKPVLGISYITLCAAWLSAFVIPLDWDRPWQKWPIPCVLGTMIGHAIGQVYAFIFYYKHSF